MSRTWFGVVALSIVLVSQHAFGLVQYAVMDLGPGLASGVNDSGQVAGDHLGAVLYSGGTVLSLGTLPGDPYSGAYAINDGGEIVGSSGDHGFLYSHGTMTDLGNLGARPTIPYGINASGQIVGWSQASAGVTHAFLYSNGRMTDLGLLPGGSVSGAYAINSSGQIVGMAGDASGNVVGFLYANGTMTALGGLGGTTTEATAINNVGQIVGYSATVRNVYHACLFANGTVTDLGTLGGLSSQAFAINDFGQIVGQTGVGGFLYEDGTMYNLAALLPSGSGWTIQNATGINDNGWIAASGSNPIVNNGASEALLLTPTPEPASLALLAIAAAALLARRPRTSNGPSKFPEFNPVESAKSA